MTNSNSQFTINQTDEKKVRATWQLATVSDHVKCHFFYTRRDLWPQQAYLLNSFLFHYIFIRCRYVLCFGSPSRLFYSIKLPFHWWRRERNTAMEQIILNMQINGKFLSPGSYKFVQIIDNFILLRQSSGFLSFHFYCYTLTSLLIKHFTSFTYVGWKLKKNCQKNYLI